MLVTAGKSIGAGCAASSLIGAGVGIGIVFSSLIYSYCSNPDLQGTLFTYAMLGFALCEATALFGLMIVFIILFG